MNKPEIKFPINQQDIVAKTNELLQYIKFITQDLAEAYFHLRSIQEWCTHDTLTYRSGVCSQCKKNLKEKENV